MSEVKSCHVVLQPEAVSSPMYCRTHRNYKRRYVTALLWNMHRAVLAMFSQQGISPLLSVTTDRLFISGPSTLPTALTLPQYGCHLFGPQKQRARITRKWKRLFVYVANAKALFITRLNFQTRARMGTSEWTCWRNVEHQLHFQRNECATFTVVITSR